MKQFEYPRDFKGIWIAAEIYLDTRLTLGGKFLLAEIDSLDCGEGCYASNMYLAEFCQMSKATLERSLKLLVDIGLIEAAGYRGRCRIWRTCLKMRQVPASERGNYPPQNEAPSNTMSNTLSKKEKKPAPPAVSYHEKLVQKFRSAEEKGELPYIVLYGFELKNNGPFGNYGKEWKAVRQVEKKVRTVCTGDQDRVHFLRLMMSAYLWKKARSKSEFWREAPLTPSGLNSRWDQTYEVCRKRLSEQGDMDWIKKAMAHS